MSNNNVWLSGLLALDSVQADSREPTVQVRMHTDHSLFGGQHLVQLEKDAAHIFVRENPRPTDHGIRTRGASISGSLVSQGDSAIVVGRRIAFHNSYAVPFINQVWLQGLLQIQSVQEVTYNGRTVEAIHGWVYTDKQMFGGRQPVIITASRPKWAICKAKVSPDTKDLPEVLVQGQLATINGLTTVNIKRIDFLGNVSPRR